MQSEVFLVIQKRKDGKLPDPIKVMCATGFQSLHFDRKDAIEARNAINRELSIDTAGVSVLDLR